MRGEGRRFWGAWGGARPEPGARGRELGVQRGLGCRGDLGCRLVCGCRIDPQVPPGLGAQAAPGCHQESQRGHGDGSGFQGHPVPHRPRTVRPLRPGPSVHCTFAMAGESPQGPWDHLPVPGGTCDNALRWGHPPTLTSGLPKSRVGCMKFEVRSGVRSSMAFYLFIFKELARLLIDSL